LKENFDRFTHENFKEMEMADFRKMLFVLAGLLIIIGTASAQVTCTAFVANQPILRQEGTTEPAGDITISCTGVPLGAQTGPQTLSLYVSGAAITSRQLFSGSTAPSAGTSIPTEAAVLVNDNTANAVQGFLQNGALVFSGSNFLLPTTGSFSIRITNVRVNANSVPAGSFITGTVLATFPIQNQSGLVLGVAQTSLSVAAVSSTAPSLTQCTSTPTTGTPAGTTISNLTIKELVNTAFKSPNVCPGSAACGAFSNSVPGQWYQNGLNNESQTVITPLPGTWMDPLGAVPGQADAATRIRINFSNIPAGVTLTVPVTIADSLSGASGTFLVATSGGDLGSFSPASGTTITLTSSGSVTYQFVTTTQASNSTSAGGIDSFTVPVTVAYTYTPPSTPNVGTILASATYAPTTAEVTLLNGQIPRFADTSVLTPLFIIAACQTDLLYTFLTNQAGYDTGISISNTSADPFGTAAQNGTCSLNWYGTGPAAGTSTTTPSIAAGATYVNLVSSLAAGFQGYMIAVCNFQFGHGFAFLRDGYGQPGQGLSQGYVANIIPTPGLTSGSSGCTANARCAIDASHAGSTTQGEALNQ
jgi:hypothetical protein